MVILILSFLPSVFLLLLNNLLNGVEKDVGMLLLEDEHGS
jgi:hypothetical protein